MAREQPEWRPGRAFTVDQIIHSLQGIPVAIKGARYIVQSDMQYFREGYPDNIVRVISEVKFELMRHLIWEGQKITPALKSLIRQNPKGGLIRGLVRAELNQIMPREETPDTLEGWMEWIDKIVVPVPVPGAPPINNATALPRVEVSVEAVELTSVRQTGSRNEYYSGTIDVPVEVLREGREETMQWLYDNITDCLECDSGEEQWDGDVEVIDADGVEIQETDVDAVIERLRQEAAIPN
jgi:hypothetical protein